MCIVGCGVFATKSFWKCDFLLEYHGELITSNEGEIRYGSAACGSFLYFFETEGKNKMWYVISWHTTNA